MKAQELRDNVEKEKEKEIPVVDKNNEFYQSHREEVMEAYLNDVGPISKFINENLAKIKNSGKEK